MVPGGWYSEMGTAVSESDKTVAGQRGDLPWDTSSWLLHGRISVFHKEQLLRVYLSAWEGPSSG